MYATTDDGNRNTNHTSVSMTRLESINWGAQTVHMKIRGSLAVPETALSAKPPKPSPSPARSQSSPDFSVSPVESLDSVFASRPTSSMPWPYHKHLIHGGPGFSIGVLDSTTGNVDHIPVPVPNVSSMEISENLPCDNFSLSEVFCMAVVGDSQVWVGTESSSLHVFDLTPELRLSRHLYTSLTGPILCIATRQMAERARSQDSRMEVLLGSPYGTVTIINAELDERGGLKNPLKGLRKLIQLGSSEEEECSVDCIAHVNCSGTETYWCSCKDEIVIVSRSNWKEIRRVDGKGNAPIQPYGDAPHVTHLVSSECGVWSCLSHSSTVLLWDTKKFEPKLKVTCCNYCTTDGWVDDFAQITALSFAYPQLFVGTDGGHLLVFKVLENLPILRRRNSITATSNRTKLAIDYKLISATHCGPLPITGIQPIPVRREFPSRSPLESSSGTPNFSVQVLLICGSVSDQEVSSSQVQLYELFSSPRVSPVMSPLSCRSDSLSICSNYSSSSNQRGSVSRSLPKLTLHSASEKTLTCLPLKDSD